MLDALGPLADRDVWQLDDPWFRERFGIGDGSKLWHIDGRQLRLQDEPRRRFELDFAGVPDRLRIELKLGLALLLNDPRKRTGNWFRRAKNLVPWFATLPSDYGTPCLADMAPKSLRGDFDSWLATRLPERRMRTSWVTKGEVRHRDYLPDRSMPANDLYYAVRLFCEGLKPLEERDWMRAEDLGFRDLPPLAEADHLLNFDRITLPWLRAATRKYIVAKAMTRDLGWRTIIGVLSRVVFLDKFLRERFGEPPLSILSKKLIVEDFKAFGLECGMAGYQWFSDICVFLHFCADRQLPGWPILTIGSDHYPRARKSTRQYLAESPERAISPEVLAAILDHIDELPAWVKRIFILGRYTGYRRADLHECPFHLLQPDDGEFMQLIRHHSKTDTVTRQLVKIDDEIGQLIIKTVTDQQVEMREQFGFEPEYLFSTSRSGDAKPAARRPNQSADLINRLLVRHRIIDPKTGEQAAFNWHSLRHHRGTELALQGFDLIFIQSELGHSTPYMTLHYIGRRNDLKKKAIREKGAGYFLNIYGDIVVPRTDPDTELKKQQILATWTNGGRCGLPAQVGEWCEHADACLGCRHFEADSDSLEYFEERQVRLDATVQAQSMRVQQLTEEGRARLAEIERRRLERNREAQTGCGNIVRAIREHGMYRGTESNYRKADA
jgi:integrase